MEAFVLADKLIKEHRLTKNEWRRLLEGRNVCLTKKLQEAARKATDEVFGRKVYVRGLIEFTNRCRQDCYYCGIRCSNSYVKRYRLTCEEILECCVSGYDAGFRTFVLQGGEDAFLRTRYFAGL